MAHECHSSLGSLVLIEVVEQLCHVVNLIEVVEQRHTEVNLNVLQILVVEVCILHITIVGELLHCSNNVCELLTRDNLEALHVNLAVLGSTDGMEQIARLIVVALFSVLAGACAVDADV